MNSLKNDIINSGLGRARVYPNGSSKNGSALEYVSPSTDINSEHYDPVADIFELFNEPSALNDIKHLLKYSSSYQSNLAKEIERERQEYKQTLRGSNPDQDVNQLDDEVLTLIDSFQNLKGLVEATGSTINSMTANIKSLDQSKKNLTFTMTTLKRLQMLVTAYDRLEKQLEHEKQIKNYLDIKQLLSAVLELNAYFQDFKSIAEINKLNKLISEMKSQIINDIFHDFESEYNEEIINDQLPEACNILEILGTPYVTQLETWYINTVLKDITDIFRSTEEAGSLDNLNRRFIYFQNILTNFESKHIKMFPKKWQMSLKLTEKFCNYTKDDLKEVLAKESRLKTNTDASLLLQSLSETLDFEQFLNKKFKHYKDLDEQLKNNSNSINFTKSISDVFEPYLNIWIDSQSSIIEKKLIEFSNPSNMFKKTGDGIVDGDKDEKPDKKAEDSINVLESAAELFRVYRQMLSQLSKLTTGRSLIRLSKIFGKYLTQYQHKILDTILPDSKSLISVELKDQQEGIEIICLVLNTATYCSSTISQLEDKIKSLIEPTELSSQIEFELPNNGFLQLTSYCINLIFYKIENDIQLSWKELLNFNWRVLSEVVGESRYTTSLKSIIKENCQFIFPKLSKQIYIRNIIDKLIAMLLNNILLNIVKLEPISIIMAEQFKLDLQELKSFINILPTLAENSEKILSSNSFKSNVNIKFKNIDNLMKILMVPDKPMDTFINSYFSIIADSSFSNFMKILQLKGVLKNEATEKDKFKYMDMFKLQLGSYEESSDDNALLKESDEYLEKINVVNSTSTITKSHGHSKSNSRSIYLPSTVSGNSPALTSTTTLSPPSPPPSTSPNLESVSPKPNFGFFNNSKIDSTSLLNTKDNLEKNIAKTFSENKTSFNENFRKLFKRGE